MTDPELAAIVRANRMIAHATTVLLPFAMAGVIPSEDALAKSLGDVLTKDCSDDEGLWPAIIEWTGKAVSQAKHML